MGDQEACHPPGKQEPVAKCRHKVMALRPESLLLDVRSHYLPPPTIPPPAYPIPKASPTHALDPLTSMARRDPEMSSRPFPCFCACLSFQIPGTEGASEMIQCLESHTCQGTPVTWRDLQQTQTLLMYPKILIWGLGKGPGIGSHQVPTQPAHRPVFGNHSSLSRYLLNTCYVPGTVEALGNS